MSDRPAHTHSCPAPGCRVELPAHLLMCKPHWRLVPPALRYQVNQTFYQRGHNADARAAYAAAARAAIAALEAVTP